jgi:transposase
VPPSCLGALESGNVELQRFSGSLKIFVLVEPCDMRKGFNGLYGMVSTTFGEDPRSGALLVFSNRRHTRIKILYWDGSDLWVLTKKPNDWSAAASAGHRLSQERVSS